MLVIEVIVRHQPMIVGGRKGKNFRESLAINYVPGLTAYYEINLQAKKGGQ
ncbi:MAG: hypothetical protein Q8L15_06195 [Methylobacter sp.]|nr:hypothetical protein [Methylobacter sp.]